MRSYSRSQPVVLLSAWHSLALALTPTRPTHLDPIIYGGSFAGYLSSFYPHPKLISVLSSRPLHRQLTLTIAQIFPFGTAEIASLVPICLPN